MPINGKNITNNSSASYESSTNLQGEG